MEMKKIYLLDTDVIAEGSKIYSSEKLISMLDSNSDRCAIPAAVWFEFLKGINVLPDGNRKECLKKFAYDIIQPAYPVIPYDDHCASVHAGIFVAMQKMGLPVSQLDMQIAATAIANNMVIITGNTSRFEPIQHEYSLQVENWFI